MNKCINERSRHIKPSFIVIIITSKQRKIDCRCFCFTGKPKPHVWWWKGETLIDTTDEPSGFSNIMNNQLVVSRLSRFDLHTVYTCQASNTNITQPVQTSVTVEMHRE